MLSPELVLSPDDMLDATEGNLSEQDSLHDPETRSDRPGYFNPPTESEKQASHAASMERLGSQGNLSK